MNMSHLRFVVVVAGLSLVAGACARPNPRITKMTRAQGNGSLTTRFDYDDHGHPTDVSAETGNGTDDTQLTFDGSQLTKIETVHNKSFGKSSTDVTDLTYENGRLSKMVTDVGDSSSTVTVTFEYDDHNNLTKYTSADVTDSKNSLTVSTTLEYGDKGLTRQTVQTDLLLAGFESKGTTVNDVSYGDDGRPSKFTSDPDQGDTTTIDLTYDQQKGNRLSEQQASTSKGNTATDRYDYDDQGRINSATLEAKGQDDVNVTIEYDDSADVVDIDMTPNSLQLVQLFDLRGDAFNTIDPTRQAVRLGGLSW